MLERRLLPLLLVILCALSLGACGARANSDGLQRESVYSFVDDTGREVKVPHAPASVVSLYASYAELWVSCGGSLAGATDDAVLERTLLPTGTPVVGTSMAPNLEAVIALQPDFVILSADVTAQLKLADVLDAAQIPHAYFTQESYEDYVHMINIFSELLGTQEAVKAQTDAVCQQVEDVLSATQRQTGHPTVLLLRSMSSRMDVLKEDSMVGNMLKELGADNIASHDDSPLSTLNMESIVLTNPDFLFITVMGDEAKAMDTMRATLMENPAWSGLQAVQDDHVYLLPKDLFHYKPNERWGECYTYLAEKLYGCEK